MNEQVVGDEVEALAFHCAAAPELNPPHLAIQAGPRIAAGEIAHSARLPVVAAHLGVSARAAARFLSAGQA